MFPCSSLSPSSPSSPSGIGVGRHQWHKKLCGHAVADVSEATGRNLIDHGQRIHVEFQGHLLRWKRWTFFLKQIYHGKIIFTSTLEIMKHLLNLADWNRSNHIKPTSLSIGGDDFSFFKSIMSVCSRTVTQVRQVCTVPLYAVSLFLFLGATKVWCLETRHKSLLHMSLEKPWSEKRWKELQAGDTWRYL